MGGQRQQGLCEKECVFVFMSGRICIFITVSTFLNIGVIKIVSNS